MIAFAGALRLVAGAERGVRFTVRPRWDWRNGTPL